MSYPTHEESVICPAPFDPRGGLGSPVPDVARATRPNLTREYVASNAGYHATTVPLALPPTIDDVMRERGSRHYEWMMTDPVVSASVRALTLAILAGGIDLKSAYEPDPVAKAKKKADAAAKARAARQAPSEAEGTIIPAVPAEPVAEPVDPKEEKSKEIVDFCWRAVERCKGWHAFLTGLLGASALGNKMAEKVFEVAQTGPDAGKLVWKAIKVKPRESWQFVVDDKQNVLGVLYRDPGGVRTFLGREKVVILSWDPVDSDPRGTSILRPAVEPCNLKRLIWPQLYKHACQFGSASLLGTTAPGEVDRAPLDENGEAVAGAALISPQQFMASQLVNFQNGSVLVVPAGAEVTPIQPQGDGKVFHAAVELFDRQIVQAILLQTRATTEAQHGSKADSETGQDIFGLLVESGRQMLAQTLRDDCFRQLVALNFGDEVADEFTPLVTFGTEQQDRAALWGAVASLMSSGYLGASQMEELDAELGLPIRDVAADEAGAAAKAEHAAKLATPVAEAEKAEGDASEKGPPGKG